MIPRRIIDNLVNTFVYIYVKGIEKEFGGKIKELTAGDIIVLEDKNNNLVYIPISEVRIITERN